MINGGGIGMKRMRQSIISGLTTITLLIGGASIVRAEDVKQAEADAYRPKITLHYGEDFDMDRLEFSRIGLSRDNVDAEFRAGFERSQCIGLLVDNHLVSTFDEKMAVLALPSTIFNIHKGRGVNSGLRYGPCAVTG